MLRTNRYAILAKAQDEGEGHAIMNIRACSEVLPAHFHTAGHLVTKNKSNKNRKQSSVKVQHQVKLPWTQERQNS